MSRAADAPAPSSEWRRVTTVGEARLLPHEHPRTTSYSAGWHSPVPYLFGGLAAMMGLIAFALLILACSYLQFAGSPPEGEGDDVESGTGGEKASAGGGEGGTRWEAYWNVVAVAMPGQAMPSFLATPTGGSCSSGGKVSKPGEDEVRQGNRGEDAPHHHQPPRLSSGANLAL